MKIASVVVTYNRKELLLRNIRSQLNQTYKINKIIIIDNASTDGTFDYLSDNGIFNCSNIEYHRLKENLGGAGGFEQGVKLASESDADAYLLMDDDGYMFNEETVNNLVKHVPNSPLYVVSSWLVFDKDNPIYADCRLDNNEIADFICTFNSTLFSKALVKKIGFPNGSFFIRGDEVDYAMRSREAKAKILTACDSIYYHPQMCRGEKKILFLHFYNLYDSPWKEYYQVRNNTYNFRKKSKLRAYLSYVKYRFGLNLFPINNRNEIKKFMKLGYKHGKRGILGKTIMPGQNKF